MQKRKERGKREKDQGKGKKARAKVAAKRGAGASRRVRKRKRKVPPPESAVWPQEYRGPRWKSVFAILFAGKCQLCAYSCPLPKSRQLRDKLLRVNRLLLCTNHPAGPGELVEVLPTDTCRNFKAKRWFRRPASPAQDASDSATCASCPGVRRIPVGQGLFATVDAADFEMLSKYKWYVYRRGRTAYAFCRQKGKPVYMHRMIMRPRKGYVVDHIDGNGLNNRHCNLRVCTPAQNRANVRSHGGSSQYVGVYRHGNKWTAEITSRGKHYYLGLFDDEVEAAKVRDRKAYELNGEHAYLNFPEDFGR